MFKNQTGVTGIHLFGLSLLTGLLLALGWPAIGNFSPLLFFAFVPLIFSEYHACNSQRSFWPYPLIAFITFNSLTTWWIFCVSESFATKFFVVASAVMVNSVMMTLVFMLFRFTKKHLGAQRGYIALVMYWLAFEYIHYHWELTWPWLTLGNAFASQAGWIQWYEYTGVFGGSLWILTANLLIFLILKRSILDGMKFSGNRLALILIAVVLLAPVVVSRIMYDQYAEQGAPIDVTIIQPNIDPYNEKYESSGTEQLAKMLDLVREHKGQDATFLVAPETALSGNIQENRIEQTRAVIMIRDFLREHPGTIFVSGMSSWKLLGKDEMTSTARKFPDGEEHYDMYNAAIQVSYGEPSQIYHKSKLVQGVEKMPFASILKPLESLALDLGGTTGSLGSQDESTVFSTSGGISIAPVICYESIYGEYVSGYVSKGAELIFIMTNDGWWGDTPGYRQHAAYARLRAIENRRAVARSANTGISCFINQRGDILRSTDWWEPAVLPGKLHANGKLTFYTKYGNYLARIASFLSAALLVISFVNSRRKHGLQG